MEIGCCHAGTGLLTLKDTSYKYANGTIRVIPKNSPHTTTGDNPTGNHWEYLFIDVEKSIRTLYPTDDAQAELLLSRINKNAFFTTTMESPELSALIQAILREMSMRREMYADSVNGLLRSLFIEIAQKCGFSSIATFNRNFRRYAGTTPKEWRKSSDTRTSDN